MGAVTFSLEPPDQLNEMNWNSVIPILGMITVLYTLERLEDDGFYEECARIVEGISHTSLMVKEEYPTRLTEEFIDDIIETYRDITDTDKSRDYIIGMYKDRHITLLQELGYKWVT